MTTQEYQSIVGTLRAELAREQELRRRSDEFRERIRGENRMLKDRRGHLSAIVETLRAENAALHGQLAESREELAGLKELVVDGTKSRANAQAQYETLRTELAAKTEANQLLNKSLATAHCGLSSLRAENAELRNGFPCIGQDPLKMEKRDGFEESFVRLKSGLNIQQKGVPDQTALVWRIDISRVSDEVIIQTGRAEFRLKQVEQLKAELALKEKAMSVIDKAVGDAGDEEMSVLCERLTTERDTALAEVERLNLQLHPPECKICGSCHSGDCATI